MPGADNPFSRMIEVLQQQARKTSGPAWGWGEVSGTAPLRVLYQGVQLAADQLADADKWAAALTIGDKVAVLPNREDGQFAIIRPGETDCAPADHDHDEAYLAIAGKAADSSKLDGKTLAQVIADAVAEVNSKNRRVGTLYWTLYNTVADRPATLFGGTWVLLTSGTFPVAGAATGDYIPGDATKGEGGEATHTLSSAEIPAHNHPIPAKSGASGLGAWGNVAFPSNTGTETSMNTSNSSGGGGAHNNMPPWKAYYIWEKTAN